MSKAEDIALSKFPVLKTELGDVNYLPRISFIEGYSLAERELELTIEDIEKIHTFLYAIKHNKQGVFTFTRLSDEQYQEVLKRFKERK